MSLERDIELIDDLCAEPAEAAWLEFKVNNFNPKEVGVRCSALSNVARIEDRDCAYMVWGVEDGSHRIVGTSFNPDLRKVGNEEFQLWLAKQLQPSIAFSFRKIEHPDGQIVLMEIPATPSVPVAFQNIPYIRIGSATPKLADYPERHQRLIDCLRPYAWEQGIAKQYVTGDEVLELLDYTSYFRLTEQRLPDNRKGIFEYLEADQLIQADVGDKWNITQLGAILFATDLQRFNSKLARKSVRLIAYDGGNRAATVTHRLNDKKGYAVGFEGLLGFINDVLPRNEHIGSALREAQPLFPKLAVRELVANALIHQDMAVMGAGPQIELFSDRIEITNPGCPLMAVDRMIDLPPRSRNEAIATLMNRMGMCEEQGSGLDKVIDQAELFQLPPPLFRENEASMQEVLYGTRPFAKMTPDERVRACYQHAVLKFLSGERMKNATLSERFGIDSRNASQTSGVIKRAQEGGYIKVADPEHPRAGYVPNWD